MRKNRLKPFIIPVFFPHAACPRRCAYCNQSVLTRHKPGLLSPERVAAVIQQFLPYKGPRRGKVQIAFFGGNFLGIAYDRLRPILQTASRFVQDGAVDSLRFSTRPDTVNPEILDQISAFPVETIEIGVQSMDDAVLTASRRGHTAADTLAAVRYLKQAGYEIGIQMMTGLPGDTPAKSMETTRRIIALSPDFVRIYPTVVLRGSPLARWYREGSYTPMSLDRCVALVKALFLQFRNHGIDVIRMGLPATESFQEGSTVLAGPYHPAFGHLVLSSLFLDRAITAIEPQKRMYRAFRLRVHPTNVSRLRGWKNQNVERLMERYNLSVLDVVADPAIDPDKLTAEGFS